ncbi:PfkB family carbohydrate kinase [Kaistia dalseonensis]|uniref:Sugar/nucleoside kinase (Ribokinase family) n=1 Tax=Kaistia dalseonensis TaxID=410840 RepID=A0ABU0H8U2_9HYPH|nr:PfkB family carbohydrate kinase [Kaistia dalseonensis]MCX5496129.1 PfkB family carbohydrate kinase [Kaistia dalseonensis]MDQ0438738.1 sugar/nucleoside kinase (ribokinase family) [Kaistia dalseonensis]
MSRIYCLSTVDLDRVFQVDHLPAHDEKLFATAYSEGAGGQGVYVARALAGLGAPVTFVGTVGDDMTGAALVAAMEAIPGLDVQITRLPGEASGSCVILVDGTGEKALVLAPISNALVEKLGADLTVEPGDIVTANFFHPLSIQALFKRLRNAGALTMIDIEKTGVAVWGWPAALDTAASADVICANQVTLDDWCAREGVTGGQIERAEAFARALAGESRRVCVTLGADGVLAFANGDAVHIPALPIKPANTTGAGDSFLGGLAFALRRGDDFTAAARFACAVAADFLVHGAVDPRRLGV